MYGWRGRIGLLVPSINTTMETEFWRIAPPGVSVHVARIAGGRHGTMGVDPGIADCGSLLRKLSEPGALKQPPKRLRKSA